MRPVSLFTLFVALAAPAWSQETIFRSYLDSGIKAMGVADYPAAEKYFRLALKEANAFPEDDARRDQAMRQLAQALDRQFKYMEAEVLYRQSLTRVERGKDQNNLAHGLTLFANHYRHREKYDLAEPLYKQALAIREKVNGPKAWETAQLMRDFADMNRDMGRADEAEAIYKQAITILEPIKDREYHLAFCLANLGELYLRQGKLDEAEALCRQALVIYKRGKWAAMQFNLALCHGTLGEALAQQKKDADAAAAFAEALRYMEEGKAAGVRTLPMMRYAAKSLRAQGKTAEAETLEAQAAEIAARHKKGNE